MATPETKLPLKVMIDSKRNKVLFAEAGSDFVDVLLSFLTLPLGTIIRRLNQHFGDKTDALGCFKNLYSSVENLSYSDFVVKEDRDMLLHPKNASQSMYLKLNVDDSKLTSYYSCNTLFLASLTCCPEITIEQNKICPRCHRNTKFSSVFFTDCKGSVFADLSISFIITDDLRLMPSLDGLTFEIIQHLASDVDELEEKTIKVGLNEIMHLLRWSLLSPTPLTNLLLWQLKLKSHIVEPISRAFAPLEPIAVQTEDAKKTVIKAVVQKSTNKLLFYLVGVGLVNFLFKLPTLPLGSVLSLLGGSTSLGSIDNLYSSVSKLKSEYFIVSRKEFLINPEVVLDTSTNLVKFLSFNANAKPRSKCLQLLDLVSEKRLIKGSSTFMVTDDLVVTPLTSMSIISILQSRKIPVSHVKELTINIGSKEALDFLKASLTPSTSVLSNAL